MPIIGFPLLWWFLFRSKHGGCQAPAGWLGNTPPDDAQFVEGRGGVCRMNLPGHSIMSSGEGRRMTSALTMDAPEASAEDIGRGLAAASAVFTAAGTSAAQAALACWTREFQEHQAEDEIVPLTSAEHVYADAWYAAGTVALATCYPNGAKPPETAQLKLVTLDRRKS